MQAPDKIYQRKKEIMYLQHSREQNEAQGFSTNVKHAGMAYFSSKDLEPICRS